MKNGTEYAKRVKRVYDKLRGAVSGPPPEEQTDPTGQFVLGLLGWETTRAQAGKALRKLSKQMADLNEVRVAAVREIASVIRDVVPDSNECARCIRRSLNEIFRRENRVSLDSLRDKGRREARQYLESLQGSIPYASASVLLWSLGAHAIPANRPLLEALRAENLVDPGAGPAEVQAFLERNIAASEARRFSLAMEQFVDRRLAGPASKAEAHKKTTRATSAPGGADADRRSKKTGRR